MKFSLRLAILGILALPLFMSGCTCSHHDTPPEIAPPAAAPAEGTPPPEGGAMEDVPPVAPGELPPEDSEEGDVPPPDTAPDQGTAPHGK